MSKDKSVANTLVIKDALFPHSHAQALWSALQQRAPTLCAWLNSSHGTVRTHNPLVDRCTALEHLLISQSGFKPDRHQAMSAGMALILALQEDFWQQVPANDPFWLVELVHITPGREGASLLPARLLDIDPAESEALLESLLPYMEDTPFGFEPLSAHHWQVTGDTPLAAPVATPELIFETTVQDWWDTSETGRAWRQWANEIQMLWFNHPVNHQRQRNNLRPINAVWLMGGAYGAQLPQAAQMANGGLVLPTVLTQLESSFKAQDWQQWLTDIETIDQEIARITPQRIAFTGPDGYLLTEPSKPLHFLQRLLPSYKTGQECWLNPF